MGRAREERRRTPPPGEAPEGGTEALGLGALILLCSSYPCSSRTCGSSPAGEKWRIARVSGEQGGSIPSLAPGGSRPCGSRSVGGWQGREEKGFTGTGNPEGDSLKNFYLFIV